MPWCGRKVIILKLSTPSALERFRSLKPEAVLQAKIIVLAEPGGPLSHFSSSYIRRRE